ncbi:FAD-linked oxidoreductase-like protein [Aspergillus novoparasiticus]|uniref:Proline dehydrogenase n=1 Tax=Aspergillus novoparasiticus TaxID=986946 RepID=A0A5N6F450_9EURO|nr:FAD-linked oxidoreductase-like protein [Aspergillus novoparasiticus]
MFPIDKGDHSVLYRCVDPRPRDSVPTGLGRYVIFHILSAPPSCICQKKVATVSPMERLPTRVLLWSLILTSLMSSKSLMRLALTILKLLATSKSPFLNADRNRILNKALRLTVYDNFCAGTNHAEVSKTIADTKRIGYHGVILGYSKVIVLNPNDQPSSDTSSGNYSDRCYEMIYEWKEGTLKTLRMLEPGDFLAVKLTGAGPISVDAMAAHQPMPEVVAKAVDTTCVATAQQGSRLWLDAEQQVLQPGLDKWATPLVYNTIQGYLKGSKSNVDNYIKLAAQKGGSLGFKLVRGHISYDMSADMLLCRRLLAEAENLQFPAPALFFATHNAASTAKAITTHQKRLLEGQPTVTLECGQIQGMADELSCELLHNVSSKDFQVLTWGSVAECMGYLHRRAIENRGAVDRTQYMVAAIREELWRRLFE